MKKPARDPSVSAEPHMRGGGFESDPSERRVERKQRDRVVPGSEKAEHSVWDEPNLSPELVGDRPPGAPSYSAWLMERRSQVGLSRSWAITALLAVVAGPWALLGAFWGAGQTVFSVLAIVVFAPVVEEMMKVAATLYVVEKRPYLLRSPVQIILCVLAGAFAFAAVENVMYLRVYLHPASRMLVRWRWTVCVAMHMGASLTAGMGLVRVWRDVWRRGDRADVGLASPWLIGAIALHGAYNAFALALGASGYRF